MWYCEEYCKKILIVFCSLSTKEVLWIDVHVLFLCIFSLHCIPVCMYFYEEKK